MHPDRRRKLSLVATILGSSVAFVTMTVVNVSLPSLADDLDAGLAAQQWVVEAYLLALASLLLMGGALADRLGRRRVYAAGLAAFGATSLACAAAPSVEVLVAARALQGAAGALLVPGSLAIIAATFPEPRARAAAIGSWTAWTAIGTVAGPLAGGALVEAASWRLAFAVNVPLVAVALALVAIAVRESRDPDPGPLDLPGALLAAAGLGGIVLGLVEQPRAGFADARTWLPLAGGAAALAAFVVRERTVARPMLPLELFRSRDFAAANAVTLLVYAGLGALTFYLPLQLQQVAGWSALEAGFTLAPSTLAMFLLARRSAGLAARTGPRLLMTAGPIAAALAALLLTRIGSAPSYAGAVLPAVLMLGIGLALTVAPLTAAAIGAVEERHAGIASAVNNAVARVAGLLAIAAVGAAASTAAVERLDERLGAAALSPAGEAALAQARSRALSTDAGRTTGRERAIVREALADASLTGFRTAALSIAALFAAAGAVAAAVVGRRRAPPARRPAPV